MNKKVILGVILTFSLVFSGLNSSVFATDIEPRTINQPIDLDSEDEGTAVTTSDDIPVNCLDGDSEIPENCVTSEETETILEEGTADEPLVVCADESEEDCDAADSTPEEVEEDGELEEIEPELWPLVISLSALGATVVFVIIINLFGRKKS